MYKRILTIPSVLTKESAHADERLAERTNLPKSTLVSLRKDIKSKPIPHGTHHIQLEDGSFAVLKDVSRGGRKRHVVATVLSSDMSPPGTDITHVLTSEKPNKYSKVSQSEGKDSQYEGKYRVVKPYKGGVEDSSRYGFSRTDRDKESTTDRSVKKSKSVKSFPGGFSSSQSYSSSYSKVASYRPRVEVHAFKTVNGVPHVLAVKQRGQFAFPGGGIEPGQSPLEAAKREMLEETGYKIKKPKTKGSTRSYVMSPKWQKKAPKKHGKSYTGVVNQIVQADLDELDLSRYNSEGDAMKGLKLYPLDEVEKSLGSEVKRLDPSKAHEWKHRFDPAYQSIRSKNKRFKRVRFAKRALIGVGVLAGANYLRKRLKERNK